jgi:thiol-disulfide isomerase/thioredoxin
MSKRSVLSALVAGCLLVVAGWAQDKKEVPSAKGARVHAAPPRIVIASTIDSSGNLILSALETREKKISREVERNGKKTTVHGTLRYPVAVLNRQTVSLKGVTICDRDGNKLSLEQARQRLTEPTPILMTFRGEKVDPIYLKIMTKETLTFTFPSVPEFKEIRNDSSDRRAADERKRKGTITVGAKVPDFSLRTLDGKAVKFSELQKDKKRTKKGVVVLSFWCSTCSSCRHVEHHLAKLAKDYEGRAAVIALDANAGETAERVAAFARKNGLAMPIVLDPSGRTADVFGTEVTTTTVVIDGDGALRYCGQFRQGERAYVEEALKAVLAGKEVAVKTTPHEG